MPNSAYNLLQILKGETPEEDKLSTKDVVTGTALAGGKGLLAKKLLDKSLEQTLGAKRFYHGTSNESAKSILREGLDPNRGGNPKGTASIHGSPKFIRDSTGKVHIATNTLGKLIAKMHARIAENESLFSNFKGEGKTIKGYMPFMDFVKNFEKDPDHVPFHSYRSTSRVDPSTFVGSGVFDRYKTLFRNSSIKDGPAGLLKYLKSHPLRATKGLAFLTGGGLLADSALDNIKELVDKAKKSASAMGTGSFLPPEPLPNSVKANQLEQQELAQQQREANAGAGNEQLMQMQKAQEDAVNELQQTKQQLAQAQAELQNSQAQAQQQQQAAQMQAQQEIQKAQMDAQYELQSEKIKNQQKLLSVQEKYMRAAGKQKPDQNHILGSQLKRVVKKVNNLKVASAPPIIDAATGKVVGSVADTALSTATRAVPQAAVKGMGMAAGKALARAVPFVGAGVAGASAVNNLRKGNYLSAGVNALGGALSFIPGLGIPLGIGAGFLASALENKPATPPQTTPTTSPTPGLYGMGGINPRWLGTGLAPSMYQTGGMMPQQGGGVSGLLGGLFGNRQAQPQPPQRWDVGLTPSDRFAVMNQAMGKMAAQQTPEPQYPDIRKFMPNPPPPGQYIASPIPLLQAGFKQHEFKMPEAPQQGYGPIGNFIKHVIFNMGLPYLGMNNPLQPDFSKVYGSLQNNEAYKFNHPSAF